MWPSWIWPPPQVKNGSRAPGRSWLNAAATRSLIYGLRGDVQMQIVRVVVVWKDGLRSGVAAARVVVVVIGDLDDGRVGTVLRGGPAPAPRRGRGRRMLRRLSAAGPLRAPCRHWRQVAALPRTEDDDSNYDDNEEENEKDHEADANAVTRRTWPYKISNTFIQTRTKVICVGSLPNSSFVLARWQHGTDAFVAVCNCVFWLGVQPQISSFPGGPARSKSKGKK